VELTSGGKPLGYSADHRSGPTKEDGGLPAPGCFKSAAHSRLKYKCLGRKARHTCGVIGTQQPRKMECSRTSAPPAGLLKSTLPRMKYVRSSERREQESRARWILSAGSKRRCSSLLALSWEQTGRNCGSSL